MKKQLLTIISLIFLAGCANRGTSQALNPTSNVEENHISVTYTHETKLPTVHTRLGSGSHITYLMMSPYGRVEISGEKIMGGDYEPKFYEHCIIWESEPGAPLPAAETVSSTLYGVTFRGWYQYNDKVYPDKLETVPAASGTQVFAIFDGPTGGGGSSGGGGGSSGGGGSQGGGGTVVTTGYGFYFSDGRTVQATYNGESYGKQEYVAYSVSISEGSEFSLYDFSNGAKWVVSPNPYSFGGTEASPTFSNYITVNASSYVAKQTFTADVYIQLLFGADTIYFELH